MTGMLWQIHERPVLKQRFANFKGISLLEEFLIKKHYILMLVSCRNTKKAHCIFWHTVQMILFASIRFLFLLCGVQGQGDLLEPIPVFLGQRQGMTWRGHDSTVGDLERSRFHRRWPGEVTYPPHSILCKRINIFSQLCNYINVCKFFLFDKHGNDKLIIYIFLIDITIRCELIVY